MGDLDDALTAARGGDPDALGVLYRGLAGPLLGFLATQVPGRQDAEDLLGEVFAAVVKDIRRFSGDLGGFKAWIYRIATNRAIDLARRRRRRPEEPLGPDAAEALVLDPQEQAEERLRAVALWDAVMGLPEEQRRVVALRLTSGLPSSEIARILEKTTGAVKALQHRALSNLARALGAYPPGSPERLEDRR